MDRKRSTAIENEARRVVSDRPELAAEHGHLLRLLRCPRCCGDRCFYCVNIIGRVSFFVFSFTYVYFPGMI